MLEVRNLEKRFGKKIVYNKINLEFQKGIHVLLAPNGAGKTTLMNMLVTLTKPTKGDILYRGTSINNMGDRYRKRIGYLPQKTGYYKNYSAVQNLMYIAALKGIPKGEAKQKIDRLLEQFGLSEVKNKPVKTYSGGMLQRVGIIGALLNDPKILILDEPTAGLDPKERVRLKNILSELGKEKIVIVSTHITSDIEFIANKIIMIKDQKILCNDTVDKICASYYGKIYEEVLPMNMVQSFETRYFVLMQQYEGNQVKVRFYHPYKEQDSWKKVMPNLEDVFMCEYKDAITLREER